MTEDTVSLTPSQKKLLKTWWKKVMTNGIELKQTVNKRKQEKMGC